MRALFPRAFPRPASHDKGSRPVLNQRPDTRYIFPIRVTSSAHHSRLETIVMKSTATSGAATAVRSEEKEEQTNTRAFYFFMAMLGIAVILLIVGLFTF